MLDDIAALTGGSGRCAGSARERWKIRGLRPDRAGVILADPIALKETFGGRV